MFWGDPKCFAGTVIQIPDLKHIIHEKEITKYKMTLNYNTHLQRKGSTITEVIKCHRFNRSNPNFDYLSYLKYWPREHNEYKFSSKICLPKKRPNKQNSLTKPLPSKLNDNDIMGMKSVKPSHEKPIFSTTCTKIYSI